MINTEYSTLLNRLFELVPTCQRGAKRKIALSFYKKKRLREKIKKNVKVIFCEVAIVALAEAGAALVDNQISCS